MRGQGGHLVFPQCHKLSKRRIKSYFLSSFIEFHSSVSEKKSKMSHAIRGQGGHLVFFLDLASWQDLITIERYQRSWKCLSQSDAGTAILFFQSARKYKLSKRRIKSYFLSSFVEFHSATSEKKSKMSQPIRGRAAILFFRSARKNPQTW